MTQMCLQTSTGAAPLPYTHRIVLHVLLVLHPHVSGAGLSSSSALVVAALSALMGLALGAAWDGAGTSQVTEVQEGGEVGRQVLLPTLQQASGAMHVCAMHVHLLPHTAQSV